MTAAIGFAFDSFVLLMAPLVVPPALTELLEAPSEQSGRECVGRLHVLHPGGRRRHLRADRRLPDGPVRPAARARVEHPSVRVVGVCRRLLHHGRMLLFLRCCTFVGVCVEFVAAVAWLAELFPDPKRRETSSAGRRRSDRSAACWSPGAYYLIVTYAESLPAIAGGHEAWRYTLMSGVIPAIPLIIIRPFLPESPAWREKKAAGTLKRPSFAELFAPRFRTDDDRHDGDDGVRVRRGVRRDSADAAHRARAARGARRCRGRRSEQIVERRAVVSGVRRARRHESCWHFSPCGSSAAAGSCASSRCRA